LGFHFAEFLPIWIPSPPYRYVMRQSGKRPDSQTERQNEKEYKRKHTFLFKSDRRLDSNRAPKKNVRKPDIETLTNGPSQRAGLFYLPFVTFIGCILGTILV